MKSEAALISETLSKLDPRLFPQHFDLIVYLHFFSESYGAGRRTCNLSVKQLQTLTHSSRNTVRGSLRRLQETNWIELIEDFEKRVSRKWLVRSPDDVRNSPGGNSCISESTPGENLTQARVITHPAPRSITDPYKYSLKTNSKNSLSQNSGSEK